MRDPGVLAGDGQDAFPGGSFSGGDYAVCNKKIL
jgi:hypothetical protein